MQNRLRAGAADVARVAANRGTCDAALSILESLPREQPGLPFTAGGLADTIATATMALQVADVESKCGRGESGQARRERLAKALDVDSAPLPTAIAAAALGQIGRAATNAQRVRMEQALASAPPRSNRRARATRGLLECARSLLFAGLGRADAASASWQRVSIFPIRLSARPRALATVGTILSFARWTVVAALLFSSPSAEAGVRRIWAVNDGEKVRRTPNHPAAARNSTWTAAPYGCSARATRSSPFN